MDRNRLLTCIDFATNLVCFAIKHEWMDMNENFDFKELLTTSSGEYKYFSIHKAAQKFGNELLRLPVTLKIILENILRHQDGKSVTHADIKAFADWVKNKSSTAEVAYRPSRVLMQDFTGVPAIVDLAAMRDAMIELGQDPKQINPISKVDLVIDHSVQVDNHGTNDSFEKNVAIEFKRNGERYEFLKWGQQAFNNFRVVPPGTGICHQVNLEYLGEVVSHNTNSNGEKTAFPDTLVGTDSHTTMINGLAILGWGVGGIEAEAAMLGQPISMLIPEVLGFKLTGNLPSGVTATDLVLTVTQILRKEGVVGKFVEFYGDGLKNLSLADRATISNMSPEYGATCGFFPVDEETLNYLKLTSREDSLVELVEKYSKSQGMWVGKDFNGNKHINNANLVFSHTLELDLSSVEPCIAGPKRPQDKILLKNASSAFAKDVTQTFGASNPNEVFNVKNHNHTITHGDIVIASITSCTNTSNPSVVIAAGLIAKKASELGMQTKPWVKTSLAPGSKVVSEYLEKSNLQQYLDNLGFNLVGYGCTTCIGNSGPLNTDLSDAIVDNKVVVASVLSGNRNFEGRIHPLTRANYLASPPLVVLYALAGNMNVNLTTDPIGIDKSGNKVFLKDLWPSIEEINSFVGKFVTKDMFEKKYSNVFEGEEKWQYLPSSSSSTYNWKDNSTYIKKPPYFLGMSKSVPEISNIKSARILALLGDSITTDHISPAGSISRSSPAAKYLESHNIEYINFNSYGSRRGNHEVMMRGTFANVRIRNEMTPDIEGGFTLYHTDSKGDNTEIPEPSRENIYDASMQYKNHSTKLVVIAGKEYGTGSSRDWAAKGSLLLGVKAVIAETFERIHRSNLVGMGIIPLTFKQGMDRKTLKLDGSEIIDIYGLSNLSPKQELRCTITYQDGRTKKILLDSNVFTLNECRYINHGGILNYVIRQMLR